MHKKLEKIKEAIEESDRLTEEQKDEAFEKIEIWLIDDNPFGVLKNELFEIDEYFEELFAELGLIEFL